MNAIDINAGNVATKDLHDPQGTFEIVQYIAQCLKPSVGLVHEMLQRKTATMSKERLRRRTLSAVALEETMQRETSWHEFEAKSEASSHVL